MMASSVKGVQDSVRADETHLRTAAPGLQSYSRPGKLAG